MQRFTSICFVDTEETMKTIQNKTGISNVSAAKCFVMCGLCIAVAVVMEAFKVPISLFGIYDLN